MNVGAGAVDSRVVRRYLAGVETSGGGKSMFRSMMLAVAALALAACNQGTGTQLPPVQEGAQAPSQIAPQRFRRMPS